MKITVLADGPLLVEGLTSLVDQSGREVPLGPDATIALCRCGASTTKPRCDGTQTKNGFRCSASAAQKPAPPAVAVAVWEGEGGSTPPAK